ncbi:hypothetical protein GOC72_18800 [Sinorhizobium medicae]|nr:hypothetical protein [Sinorhizobium medicae]
MNDISTMIRLLSEERAEKNDYKQWLSNANQQLFKQTETIRSQSDTIVKLQKHINEQLDLALDI